MGRLLRLASLLAVCVITFSTPLFADSVHRFTDRPNSFFDKTIYFSDNDSLLLGGHGFSEFTTYGSGQDHWNWIGGFDDHHGKGRGWHNHFRYGYGDGRWDLGDQDWDNDGNGGKKGRPSASGIGGNSAAAVSEPTVLVLLSAALAAFLLKSLSKAMVLFERKLPFRPEGR